MVIQPGRSLNGEFPPHCLFLSCMFAEHLAMALPLCAEVLQISTLEQQVCVGQPLAMQCKDARVNCKCGEEI